MWPTWLLTARSVFVPNRLAGTQCLRKRYNQDHTSVSGPRPHSFGSFFFIFSMLLSLYQVCILHAQSSAKI
jgi:hypothetical protein